MDRWVDAGHHVANHPHGYPDLMGVDADTYIKHIDLADQHLAPWTVRAPGRYFGYTRNHWGNTEDKLQRVKAHLAKNAYRMAEVTTWFFEWKWNLAYERALASTNDDAIHFLRATFFEFSVAQLNAFRWTVGSREARTCARCE